MPAGERPISFAGSTFRSGCGRCRRRRSRAANSSASISPAASYRICRCFCSTNRPPRSTLATARSSSTWWPKRSGAERRWSRSCTTTTCARRSPTPSSTSTVSRRRPEDIMGHRGLLLANARVVLAERVIEAGWVAAVDGVIVEIGEGRAPDHAEDLAGDLLLPGLVELHTDHLEAHYVPRPKVHWDPVAAVVSYDGQLATCGITTALDSLRVWREEGAEDVDGQAEILADAIAIARDADLLRLDHFLHLRCEIPMPSVVEEVS